MLLAKSTPIVVISMTGGSHFARERRMAFTPWHLEAVSGSLSPHLLLADSGHRGSRFQVLLLGVKRTSARRRQMSPSDPKRTRAAGDCWASEFGSSAPI